MSKQIYCGDIPAIANNIGNLYEGNLTHYFDVILRAPNIYNGYHGLRHMLHVPWVCYKACVYYGVNVLAPIDMRDLLIAAIFHDFDHPGKIGDDSKNIAAATRGLEKHILPEDEPRFDRIVSIFGATLYPHVDLGEDPMLEQLILRDADISSSFHPAWIGEILAGLGSEFGKSPKEMLIAQLKFLDGTKFHTKFGNEVYGDKAIIAKRLETVGLIKIMK